MPQFREKPPVVEAIQYVGENRAEVVAWAAKVWVVEAHIADIDGAFTLGTGGRLDIMRSGDWLVNLPAVGFVRLSPDQFEAKYEPVPS